MFAKHILFIKSIEFAQAQVQTKHNDVQHKESNNAYKIHYIESDNDIQNQTNDIHYMESDNDVQNQTDRYRDMHYTESNNAILHTELDNNIHYIESDNDTCTESDNDVNRI